MQRAGPATDAATEIFARVIPPIMRANTCSEHLSLGHVQNWATSYMVLSCFATVAPRLLFGHLAQQLSKNPQAANAHAPCFEIALCTPDVPQALARAIAAGAQPMRPVEVMPWGQTIAYVADINGFLVELCTPMG
jgi:hypothetical protein